MQTIACRSRLTTEKQRDSLFLGTFLWPYPQSTKNKRASQERESGTGRCPGGTLRGATDAAGRDEGPLGEGEKESRKRKPRETLREEGRSARRKQRAVAIPGLGIVICGKNPAALVRQNAFILFASTPEEL